MLVAAFFGVRSSGTSDKANVTLAKESAEAPFLYADAGDDEPSRAFILDYLRGRSTPAVTEPASAQIFTEAEATNLDVLIATVPDPIDTAFGFWYDQIVESLTRAICDTNSFAPSGQWNPWQLYQIDATSRDSKKPGFSRATPFERFPGVLLFRGTRNPKRVVVVLLVSETANAIRAEALQRALDLALEIQKTRRSREKFPLIAPVFTGAQESLFRALREWTEKHDRTARFEVISGSAIGLKRLREGSWEQKAITLHSTVVPSDILLNAALCFLRQPGDISEKVLDNDHNFKDVALLLESNTGLGRSIRNPWKDPESDYEMPRRWPMHLPFPLHMSRLQTAYAKKRLDLEKRIRPNEDWLDLSLEHRPIRPNPDTVPSLDEAQTTPINDRAVDDITATIRENRVRFVGIIATDPQDRIFLVQRIKRDCPEAQIFIIGMDLSFALPENQHIMRGVLVSTTYPLHPPNQGWTESDEPRRQTFKSQCGQGCYNAAAFHLSNLPGVKAQDPQVQLKDLLQEYTAPVFAEKLTNQRKPPVWIVTIGEKGRVVPLAFSNYGPTDINNADNSELVASAPPPSDVNQIIRPPLGTYRVAALLVLVTNIAIAGLILWRRSKWVFFRISEGQAAAASSEKSKAEREPPRGFKSWWQRCMETMDADEQRVSVYQNMILTSMMFSLIPLLAIAAGLLSPSFERVRLQCACLRSILGLLAVAWCLDAILQARIVWRFIRSRRSEWKWWVRLLTHVILATSGFAFGIGLLFPFVFPLSTSRVGNLLFIERSTAILAGWSVLSAILPMCAGFLVYACLALKLDYLGKRFEVSCPYPLHQQDRASPVDQVCGKICMVANELHEDLTDFGSFRWRYRYALSIGGLAFLPAAALVVSRYRTWEGPLWDTVFLTGFLCFAALVLITLLRFVTGWRRLEQILKLIVSVPMVGAFDRLPRKTAALFGGYLFARRPRLSHLNIPAHILRQLQHEAVEQATTKDGYDMPIPILAAAEGDFGRTSQSTTGGRASATERVCNGVQSQMPKYEQVPENIARRLATEPLDSMPKGSVHEPTLDPDYPRDQINKFSDVAKDLIGNLKGYWPWHTVADAFGEQAKTTSEADKPETDKSPSMPSWVEKAEDFVAIQVIIFLSQYFILLRTMALSMVWVSVLLLVAATEYPFQPERLILYLLLGLLGAVVVASLWVLIRVNKSEIVSRITQSTPNKFEFSWRFIQAAVQFVGPIAIIAVAQLSGRLRAIVEPLLEVIR
jgi:hypothetical protein